MHATNTMASEVGQTCGACGDGIRGVLLRGGVAVIYDQSIARGSELESATAKLQSLRSMEFWGFAYAAQVAMVIVSRDRERIVKLHGHARGIAHVLPARVLA